MAPKSACSTGFPAQRCSGTTTEPSNQTCIKITCERTGANVSLVVATEFEFADVVDQETLTM
jgi:hypothetical protein